MSLIETQCVMCTLAFTEAQMETYSILLIAEEGMKTSGPVGFMMPKYNDAETNFQFDNDSVRVMYIYLTNEDNLIDPYIVEGLFKITDEQDSWNITVTCNPQKISLEIVREIVSTCVSDLVEFKSLESKDPCETVRLMSSNLIHLKRSLYSISK